MSKATNETYLQTPPQAECFYRDGVTLITLRRNVAEATEENRMGEQETEQTVYRCEELRGTVKGRVEAEDAAAAFESYWAQLDATPEQAPTTEQRLAAVEDALLGMLGL